MYITINDIICEKRTDLFHPIKGEEVAVVVIMLWDGPLFFIGDGGYLFHKKNCSQAVVG